MFSTLSKYKEDFYIAIPVGLWIFLFLTMGLFLLNFSIDEQMDQYFWYHLENPNDGERLSYPAFANLYFEGLHQISGDNIVFFSQLAALGSFAAFLSIFGALRWMGIPLKKIMLLSLLLAPVFVLVILRIDIIAVALALFAVILFYKGYRLPAWLLLFAGALFKFFPVFFIPLFLVIELKNFNRDTLIRLGIMGILSILALFFFYDNLSTIIFHSSRGIQLESLYANILLLVNWVYPLGLEVSYNYGSQHLVIPDYLEFLVPLALLIQVAAVLAVSYLFYRSGAKTSQLFFYAFLVSLVMIITIKVFSTQFILWPLVFAIPLLAKLEAQKLPAVFFAIAFFTSLIYPLLWEQLVYLNPGAIIILTIRNALLLFVLYWFFANFKEAQRKTEYK